MTEQQPGKSAKKPSSPGRIALMGAVATGLAVFNMMGGGETPSQGVMILQYVLLAGGLIALAGGLVMTASAAR